jgi:hypothetical protein
MMRLLSRLFVIVLVLLFTGIDSFARQYLKAAVFYKAGLPSSSASDFYSACHMMHVAGLPFDTIQTVELLSQYKVVLFAESPDLTQYNDQEVSDIIAYILAGGCIILPQVRDQRFFEVAGIQNVVLNARSPSLNWQVQDNHAELQYFDDPLEIQTSLGQSSDKTIPAVSYVPSTAEVIARYADGQAGVLKNFHSLGTCYTFGFKWKEVILRSQLGYDYSANRTFSNGFEPSSDVFPLFVRAVWIQACPVAIWKHTSPNGNLSSLLITHDVDSRTGMDTMHYFSSYERSIGISSHYFVTTRYFPDDLMSAFYNSETIEKIKAVYSDGHTIGSHSVGHFPDMLDTMLFPAGKPGILPADYQPRFFNQNGHTTGGTLWGEAEVSKTLLEGDLKMNIRSWRSGHLLTPKYLFQVLDSAGYSFSSTFSANDILCNFPFMNKGKRSFHSEDTDLMEIPMTLSDVYSTNPITPDNYPQLVDIWLDVITRNTRNQAPTVLLIHPNRRYKVDAQTLLINNIPEGVGLVNFEFFADFWNTRLDMYYTLLPEGDSAVVIRISQSDLEKVPSVSFAMPRMLNLPVIRIENEFGVPQPVYYTNYSDIVLIHNRPVTGMHSNNGESRLGMSLYPNPARGIVYLHFQSSEFFVGYLSVYNIWGVQMLAHDVNIQSGVNELPINIEGLSSGLYIVVLQNLNMRISSKILVF